ncbi:MAG: hypothetical protein ABI920_01645 [Casimicrobiaceae bacterium]
MDLDVDLDRVVEPTPSRRIRTQATRQRSRAERGELAGFVRVRHAGRAYCGWYRVAGDLLTVYCGVAANTGLLPDTLPSPKPLAERLLRELVDAEHPGLNPD